MHLQNQSTLISIKYTIIDINFNKRLNVTNLTVKVLTLLIFLVYNSLLNSQKFETFNYVHLKNQLIHIFLPSKSTLRKI